MVSRAILERFDRFLEGRGLRCEGVVIGGMALNLLGFVSRTTEDCDLLAPPIQPAIKAASVAFAAEVRAAGGSLRDDWLNNGPAMLAAQLPSDWRAHLQPAFAGRALVLHALGRQDLLRSKLFALCDRSTDLADCVAMAPTAQELAAIQPWLELQDQHPGWPKHVRETLGDLARRLGHAI